MLAGVEFEWFNFRETPQSLAAKNYAQPETITPGMFGYSLLRAGQNQPFFKALMEEMPQFGIPIEGLHTETGPGVYEAAILYSDALEAADRAVLFKTAAKEIGHRFGIMPSFMAKWNAQYPGCSGHVHQSVSDGRNNLFYDAKSPRKMSKLFESYLAGQLHCLQDIQVFFAPTINSYKRLVDGFWAPVKATWGIDNRTASLRVIAGSAKSTRIETRCPGADANAYLAVAACVAAGHEAHHPAARRRQRQSKPDSAPAAQPDGGDGELAQIENRARTVWRGIRRPLRQDPRVGMAPVPGCSHRLGTQTLFRNHLIRVSVLSR